MAIQKNFVVKNGLEVSEALIYADKVADQVGIGTTSIDGNCKVEVRGNLKVRNLYLAETLGIGSIPNLQGTTLDYGYGRILSGVVTSLSGTAVTYTTGNITDLSGTAVTYTTGDITNLSGTAVTYTTGNITDLSGTAVTYTTGNITDLSGTTGDITNLSGTAVTYTTGNITDLSGTGDVQYSTGTITTLDGTSATFGTVDAESALYVGGALYDNNDLNGNLDQVLTSTGSGIVWKSPGLNVGDADLLDGLDSTQFLRSDADDEFTGNITGSGTISITGSYIEVGRTSGSVAMTINDGYGNANVAFNHRSGVPDVDGSSARIETPVDSTTAKFIFELADSVTSGIATGMTRTLMLTTSDITYKNNTVWHAGNDGAGSGLNADLLDSIDSSSFLRSDANDGFSGVLSGSSGSRISFSNSDTSYDTAGEIPTSGTHLIAGADNGNSTGTPANINLYSWNGVGFGPSITGEAITKGELSHLFNVRNGDATFIGSLTCVNVNSTSDINLKKDIEVITDATYLIKQLNGVKFAWKKNDEKSVGVIAQEVEKVLPELISEKQDTGDKSVNYSGLVGVLIEAVKELSARVEELENK